MAKQTKRTEWFTRVIRRLLSVWFYILFLGFFVLAFPFFILTLSIRSRFTHDIAHYINKIWGILITFPSGIRIRSENAEKIKKGEVYIFAPNHASYLDIPVCNVGIPISFRFMGKAELVDIPFFGWMFGRLHIAVKRESRKESYNSFHKAREKLKQGVSVLIYPEGTIPDKKSVILGRFKDGAFRLAIENQVPIVPVVMIGTDTALPDDGKLMLRPAKIRVIFEDPIETKGMTIEDVQTLKTKVYDLIHKKLTTENSMKINTSRF